jgi:prephenate dehydrogenase
VTARRDVPEAGSPPALASAVVIGTGLIGASVALALRERGVTVWLSDRDPAAARLAADIGAGTVLPDPLEGRATGGAEPLADLAVLAVPPAAVAPALAAAQTRGLARWYTDVASVKGLPLRQAREWGCDLASFVPGHPLSGRERSGPAAARADLFLGRPWVICPGPLTDPAAIAAVEALVRCCRGEPVRASAEDHDRWVALVSHAPHVVAAAMAAQLAHAPDGALGLAGQGLRDVTRIAEGETGLWAQILAANATPVAQVLGHVANDLAAAAEGLAEAGADQAEAGADQAQAGADQAGGGTGQAHAQAPQADAEHPGMKLLAGLLDQGSAGVARIPGKRGTQARDEAVVQVVIRDQPGELARLFQVAGQAGVNIEDIGIEHSPGLPVGVAELTVRPDAAARLTDALAAAGWPVRR